MDLKAVMQTGNLETINAAVETLTKASHQIAELIYRQSAGGPGGTSGQGSAGAANPQEDGDVIDAEYVDAEEKK